METRFKNKTKHWLPQWNVFTDAMFRDHLQYLHRPPGGQTPLGENIWIRRLTKKNKKNIDSQLF